MTLITKETVTIEAVTQSNLQLALPLIRQYQAFYQVKDINDENNRVFFSQFSPESSCGCQFIIYYDGHVAGFATVYFSFASSIIQKVAILNDLYTRPNLRGKGLARQLIEHCRDYAKQHNAARLQWVTAPDNQTAQTLYDKLDAQKSEWLFYSYKA